MKLRNNLDKLVKTSQKVVTIDNKKLTPPTNPNGSNPIPSINPRK